jgi:tight adherence protein C
LQNLVYMLPVVAFLVLGTLWWLQRSPRRAALATLKAATAPPKPSTPPRGSATSFLALPTQVAPGDRVVPRDALGRGVHAAIATLALLARRLSPPAYSAGVERRLTLAGRDRHVDAERYFALRLVTLILVAPAFFLILVSPLPPLYRLLAFILVTSVLSLGPEASLNRAVGERQDKIRSDLPVMVELLMISVEAGLGFDQALVRSVNSVAGPLSEEFSRFLGEVRMGAGHKDALEAIDRRTDVAELRSFLMALVQAETFGVSVGPLLRSQAEEARVAQRHHVQEQAQKAPVKMLFPLVFCVLPALFIVVVGPAAIEIYKSLIHLK